MTDTEYFNLLVDESEGCVLAAKSSLRSEGGDVNHFIHKRNEKAQHVNPTAQRRHDSLLYVSLFLLFHHVCGLVFIRFHRV